MVTSAGHLPAVVVEGQFRSGQQADRHLGWTVMNYELGTVLPDSGKATSA